MMPKPTYVRLSWCVVVLLHSSGSCSSAAGNRSVSAEIIMDGKRCLMALGFITEKRSPPLVARTDEAVTSGAQFLPEGRRRRQYPDQIPFRISTVRDVKKDEGNG